LLHPQGPTYVVSGPFKRAIRDVENRRRPIILGSGDPYLALQGKFDGWKNEFAPHLLRHSFAGSLKEMIDRLKEPQVLKVVISDDA
jgi:hypothetical protein